MGNTFNRNSSSDNDVPTPPIVALTEKEIKIIIETWKIPSANVRNFIFKLMEIGHRKVHLKLITESNISHSTFSYSSSSAGNRYSRINFLYFSRALSTQSTEVSSI